MSLEEELKELRKKKTTYLKYKRILQESFKDGKTSKAVLKEEMKKLSIQWLASKDEYYQKLKDA